jgi:hypothetical protein
MISHLFTKLDNARQEGPEFSDLIYFSTYFIKLENKDGFIVYLIRFQAIWFTPFSQP